MAEGLNHHDEETEGQKKGMALYCNLTQEDIQKALQKGNKVKESGSNWRERIHAATELADHIAEHSEMSSTSRRPCTITVQQHCRQQQVQDKSKV